MDIFENRRKWLEFWIATKASGSRSNFERMFGYSKSQLTQFLSTTYNDGRSIGDNAARKIEQAVGVTDRTMELDFEDNAEANSGKQFAHKASPKVIAQVNEKQLALIHVDEKEIRLLSMYRQADELGRSSIESAAESASKAANLALSVKNN